MKVINVAKIMNMIPKLREHVYSIESQYMISPPILIYSKLV